MALRFVLTDLLRRGNMPAVFRVSAIMHSCFDYKFDTVSTATLARAAAMLACGMVSVIPGGGRTRL
jgi:hypothetical protein